MKVDGILASVTRGVSQQAPADRLEGQMGEQVNMLGDPVRGLVRRNGMILEAEKTKDFTAEPDNAFLDSLSFRRFSYRDGGRDHDILYRSRARVGAVSDAHLDTLTVYDKTANEFLPVVRDPGDSLLDTYEANGIGALTAVGSYVLLAANDLTPTYTSVDEYRNPQWANAGAIWVRGGAYNRKFTVRTRRKSNNVEYTVEYQTPSAQFPEALVLDATTIPIQAMGGPYEQAFINQVTSQFNARETAWTVAAAKAIIPSNIAQELATRLAAAGFGGWTVRGSHLFHDDVGFLEVQDGGDGDYLRATLSDAEDVNDVTDMHRVGKVLRVQPDGANSDPYYLKAYPETPGDNATYQPVVWRETAGVRQTPNHVLAFGRRVNGFFYWASSPSRLALLIKNSAGLDVPVPTYTESNSGDLDSVPPPKFYSRPITHLTVFQDRLFIISGAVVHASKVGEYLNFYRTSALTVEADDAMEMYAVGTESDTIRQSILYDKNLLLQGDKHHYSIIGRQAMDARQPAMNVIFTMEGTAWAQPVGVGKHVYILKSDEQLGSSRLLKVHSGEYQDSPELDDAAVQLRDYVNGSPAELVGIASPGIVFVRTEHYLKSKGGFPRARPWGLYVYQFMDADNNQRVWDSWSAWEWSTALGFPIGIANSGTGDSILIYTLAYGAGPSGQRHMAINVLKGSARTDPSGLPYLDGLRPAQDAETKGLLTNKAVQAVKDVVFTSPGAAYSYDQVPATTDNDRFAGLEHPHYTVGDAPPEGADPFRWTGVAGWYADYVLAHPTGNFDNLWTGTAFPAFVDLTNPFVRNREGKPKLDGRLNLTSFQVTTTRTAGLRATWTDHDGNEVPGGFSGTYERIRYNTTVWIGREAKDVQVRLAAVSWLPLTITAISWKGNWFKY